jgi:hypothetical protein
MATDLLGQDMIEKCTTANERFGASGAVARLKVCANLQVLRPSERLWKPRLRQAASTLGKIRFALASSFHANQAAQKVRAATDHQGVRETFGP